MRKGERGKALPYLKQGQAIFKNLVAIAPHATLWQTDRDLFDSLSATSIISVSR